MRHDLQRRAHLTKTLNLGLRTVPWPGRFAGILINTEGTRGFGFVDIGTVVYLQAGGPMPRDFPRNEDLFVHVRENPSLSDPLPAAGTEIVFCARQVLHGRRRGKIEIYNAELA